MTQSRTLCTTKDVEMTNGEGGTVIGQDGKVIFVRHGSTYVEVQSCHLMKDGSDVT